MFSYIMREKLKLTGEKPFNSQNNFVCRITDSGNVLLVVNEPIYTNIRGSGSFVGIATEYELEGPGSIADGDGIFLPSITALGPTQPPVHLVPGLSRG